ncbi:MAG: sigma-54-dependent Fis family transcriptional regulator [Planctomycetaceae bacterium]|nr:sigma-54-dependent Fis family transcriptional regulator [Planctomycetaceae bacterium]
MTDTILIVDDQRSMCELLEADLKLRGYAPIAVTSAAAAWEQLQQHDVDVVLTDVRMPGTGGIDLCRQINEERPEIPVIVMTAFGSIETAVAALRAGAYDFITKPVEMDLLAAALERALKQRRLQKEVRQLSETIDHRTSFGEIVGESPAMLKLYGQLTQIAPTDSSVLITGESGTGKELVARSIHRRSRRASGPFVAVNCSAIPEALLESELFGHRKGAFTDARQERTGLFVNAHGGTLFLDEIGELPLSMQAKLLRALEERCVRPVGSDQEVAIDVRLVSATNRDLDTAIEAQQFREDLFYRINVIQIELPALRSRGNDILLLAHHYLTQFATAAGKTVTGFDTSAAERLLSYPWPGNVRELRNVMERAVALSTGTVLTRDDLPEKIRRHSAKQLILHGDDPTALMTLEEVERRYLLHVFEACHQNRTQAAEVLGLDRKTLYRKLKQYGVDET